MDVKKNFGANLEKKKKSFLAIGLLFSLAIVLAGFEYRTIKTTYPICKYQVPIEIEEIVPVSIPEKPKPRLKKKVITDIELIDNDEDEDPIEIESIDIDEDTSIDSLQVIKLDEEVIVDDEIPFIIVEQMPEFKGGVSGLMMYMKNNINYPKEAKQANRQGKVYISFVVEKDGTISNVKLLRGIGYGCDEEAMRVVGQMPKWEPGKQMGKKVRVQFNLPIAFKLNR